MSISIEKAMQLVQAAHAEAESIDLAVTAVVVDESGRVVALGRMNGARPISVDIATNKAYTPRSRSQVEPCDFCVRRVIFSRLGVKDGQKCSFKDSNVAAIMLTTPCRVSGDHSSLTLFAKILLQLVSLTLHVGWDTALFTGKYPMFT